MEADFDLNMDMDFEFDLSGFDVDFTKDDGLETGFCNPRVMKQKAIAYDKAEELAAAIEISKDINYYSIVSGNFVFGDLLEALIINKKLQVKTLYVNTLSMSENNVDSLVNIMESGLVQSLHLIVSHYFYAHERHDLIPYIEQELNDKAWDFVFAVAGTHSKMCLLETADGLKITMHGSANLRSSANIEQFNITENAELFDFNKKFLDILEEKYTINDRKGLRGKRAWLPVQAGLSEPTS